MRYLFKEVVGVIALMIALVVFATSCNGQTPCAKCGQVHGYSQAGNVEVVVTLLNRQRATRGLGPLVMDATLQQVAARRVSLMARSGRKGHPPGSFSPGRYEGVGWNSSRNPTAVNACYTYATHVTRVGAAMIRTRSGSYFACVYR